MGTLWLEAVKNAAVTPQTFHSAGEEKNPARRKCRMHCATVVATVASAEFEATIYRKKVKIQMCFNRNISL
jgi:hypothetical protein